ncbi:hypothetical protein DPMN_188292 [Dreissena polymorpha]|uniref:Uncharacterized protein n=1 Tax=Dreissena polymorpha TaxID=45954 RepID=A0A9D4DSN5_DREPO|nr:hypothetical protein DPMN_188292 [Dreissena polymorpha]
MAVEGISLPIRKKVMWQGKGHVSNLRSLDFQLSIPVIQLLTKINILTKFHKDWMKTVTSTVYTSDLIIILTKFHKDWMKTVTSTVYTSFLPSDLINILTKFHKEWMKTAISIVYTRFF